MDSATQSLVVTWICSELIPGNSRDIRLSCLADRGFQSELFQQLHVIFIGSLLLYCMQRKGVLHVLQCSFQYKCRYTMYGRTNGISPVDWGSLANHGTRVSVGKFEWLSQLLLLLRRRDPHALLGSMFLDIFAVSRPIFLKSTLLPLAN